MQLQINVPEIKTVCEQQLFNGRNLHVFVYNKAEGISRLHQHGYYKFTLVLTGRHYQKINGKCALLEHGDFIFIPLGSHHQSFHDSDATRVLDVGINRCFFKRHYHSLLPFYFATLQVYRVSSSFLTYTETVIASLNLRESGLDESVEVITFCTIDRLRHHREEQVLGNTPQWLKATVETMHDKRQSSESALGNMVHLSAKSQEYLVHATQHCYSKTPMQIINEIHINFTRKQLEVTSYSVADIAYRSGYSSPDLFIKAFKELMSFTPNSYREKLTEFNQQILFANNPLFIARPG